MNAEATTLRGVPATPPPGAAGSSRPRPSRLRPFGRYLARPVLPVLPAIVFALLFAIYDVLVRVGVLDHHYLPTVGAIGRALLRLIGSASLWSNVASTWHAAVIGFGLGLIVAIPMGLLAGRSAVVYHALRPMVEFLRPLPSVAMIPLVVLIWGPSITSKAFLAFFTTVWPVFIQTAAGVRDTDPTAIDTARSFGLREFAIVRQIILPSALPAIATAMRVQASIALLVTITAEVALGGGGGLGLLVFQFDQVGDYPGMYALIVLIGAQGMLLGSLLAMLERRLMPWHSSNRREQV